MIGALAFAVVLSVAPEGPAKQLVGIWLDHGSPYMELRPDGSGRIGLHENTWTVERELLRAVVRESGETYELPWKLLQGGKQLELIVSGTTVTLDRSRQKPGATAPPPPRPPSQLDLKDAPDAGFTKKKKGKT